MKCLLPHKTNLGALRFLSSLATVSIKATRNASSFFLVCSGSRPRSSGLPTFSLAFSSFRPCLRLLTSPINTDPAPVFGISENRFRKTACLVSHLSSDNSAGVCCGRAFNIINHLFMGESRDPFVTNKQMVATSASHSHLPEV